MRITPHYAITFVLYERFSQSFHEILDWVSIKLEWKIKRQKLWDDVYFNYFLMLLIKRPQIKTITRTNQRAYTGLIERHSNMPLIGMDTTFAVNLLQQLYFDYNLSLPISIIGLQFCFRLGQIPISFAF
jgi:hypothetical protein